MALTYFNLDRNYLILNYRFKKIRDGFLITNDFGCWVYLTEDEFLCLRHNKLRHNPSLLSLLKDKGFVMSNENVNKLTEDFRNRLRHLFRGTYHHTIDFDYNFEKNNISNGIIKKLIDFICESKSKELIIEFKTKDEDKLNLIKDFVDEFSKNKGKVFHYKVEINVNNLNDDVKEFLVEKRFNIWVTLNNIDLSEESIEKIKDIKKKLEVYFYLDINESILGKEKEIIDFFVENNFSSFFIRKSKNLNEKDFIDSWRRIIDYSYETNKNNEKVIFREGLTSILLGKILNSVNPFYPEMNPLCTGAVVSELAYTLDGNVYANKNSIGIELFNLGNVHSSYNFIVSSNESLALIGTSINSDAFMEKSVYYPYINNCPVSNYLRHGNMIPKYPNNHIFMIIGMFNHLFERILFDSQFIDFV